MLTSQGEKVRKRGKWWAALLLVMSLAVVIRVAMRPPSEITLPNGTKVRYLGAVRADHPFSTDRWIERMGRKVLPANLQHWIPPGWTGNGIGFGQTNALSVYLRVDFPTTAHRSFVFAAEDDAGFRYPPSNKLFQLGTPAKDLFQCLLQNFPRRQSRFRLHLLNYAGSVLGTLWVQNPLPASVQTWEPEPLPIRKTNGPVVLTLESATEHPPREGQFFDPKWSLSSDDPRWTNAAVVPTTLDDPSGNQVWALAEGQFPNQPEASPPLSPAEPAWKLSFAVRRSRINDFDESERVVLTNLAWPLEGEFVPIRAEHPTNGWMVVGVLGGPGDIKLADVKAAVPFDFFNPTMDFANPLERYWRNDTTFLRIDVSGIEDHSDLHVSVIDDRGGFTTVSNRLQVTHHLSPNEFRFSFEAPVVLPEGPKPVALAITAGRALKFDFIIDPKTISPQVEPAR